MNNQRVWDTDHGRQAHAAGQVFVRSIDLLFRIGFGLPLEKGHFAGMAIGDFEFVRVGYLTLYIRVVLVLDDTLAWKENSGAVSHPRRILSPKDLFTVYAIGSDPRLNRWQTGGWTDELSR
ncbi:MAG: hypothetical protein F4Z82_14910 [Caldilineaceae bacterium SB0668_bin_21]|nr:hypothetical protein [Caldilineaceae bacterium SB0668_bin_21]MYC21828.1 hypothetical protein [Caldilineaceae bacterium SB0662_bin_25]